MKSNMCIKVEFLAGTSIEDAIAEAKEKAIAWDVAYVTFSFNGIAFSISQKADAYELEEEYRSIGNSTKYIVG